MPDWIWIIPVIMLIVSLFVPRPTDAEIEQAQKEDEEYCQQHRWEERRSANSTNFVIEEDESQSRKEPEPETETPMQKFRRENTMREVVRRGGYLTTGERIEAMFGACEEATQCFPEDYQ